MRLASPDEIVFAQGDLCNEALCVESGRVLYHIYKDELFKGLTSHALWGSSSGTAGSNEGTLHSSGWFCEAALWTRWHNLGSLRSKDLSSFQKLDVVMFQQEVQQFSPALEDAVRYAQFYVRCLLELLAQDECTDMGLEYDKAFAFKREFGSVSSVASLAISSQETRGVR